MTYEEITVNADSGPGFSVGRMKRRNIDSAAFRTAASLADQSRGLLFGCPAALALGGPAFL